MNDPFDTLRAELVRLGAPAAADIGMIVDVDLAALRRVAGWLSRVKLVSRRVDLPALTEESPCFARLHWLQLSHACKLRELSVRSSHRRMSTTIR